MADTWDLRRGMFLSEEEADALLARLRRRARREIGSRGDAAQLDELIVSALLLSGLRNSEFCALTLGDAIIDSGGPAFLVRRRCGPSRTVYLPRCVSALVARYVDETRPRFLPGGVDPGDRAQPLIFNEHRRPYERSGLYRRVVRILTQAGVGDRASVQLLRHTYGYLAYVRTGGNLLFVQRQLGHAHPRITSVYAQFTQESYAEMAERVAAANTPEIAAADEGTYRQCRPAFDCEID